MDRSSAWKRVLLECFDVEGTAPKACCKSLRYHYRLQRFARCGSSKKKPREQSLAHRGLYRKRSTRSGAFVSAYCLLKRLGFLTVRVSYSERNRKRRLPPRVDTFFPSSNAHSHAERTVKVRGPSERRRRNYVCTSGRTARCTRRRRQVAAWRRPSS